MQMFDQISVEFVVMEFGGFFMVIVASIVRAFNTFRYGEYFLPEPIGMKVVFCSSEIPRCWTKCDHKHMTDIGECKFTLLHTIVIAYREAYPIDNQIPIRNDFDNNDRNPI